MRDIQRVGTPSAWLPIAVSLFCLYPVSEGNGGASYLLFGYQYGFVKRGLLGMMFMHLERLTHLKFVSAELTLLAVAFCLLYFALSRAIFASRSIGQIAAILLCAPTLLPHFAQMFTPTDTVLFALLAASLLCFTRMEAEPAAAVSLLFCLVALLVHEAYLITMYPALVCVLVHEWRRRRLPFGVLAIHLGVMATALLLVLHFGALKVDPMRAYAEAQKRSAFPLEEQVFRLMHQSLPQYVRESMRFIYYGGFIRIFALSFLFAAPYFVFVCRLLKRCLEASGYNRVQKVVVTLACCTPLVMLPLATDWTRWVSDCFVCASLFILFMYCVDTEDGPVATAMLRFAVEVDLFAWIGYTVALGAFGVMSLSSASQLIHGYYARVPVGGLIHVGQ